MPIEDGSIFAFTFEQHCRKLSGNVSFYFRQSYDLEVAALLGANERTAEATHITAFDIDGKASAVPVSCFRYPVSCILNPVFCILYSVFIVVSNYRLEM